MKDIKGEILMSKWGEEEKETLKAIEKIEFRGKVLNIAAGDGRFNEKLLELADEIIAIDINEKELKELEDKCPENLKSKLKTKCMDITKRFPFEENTFDGIFCTGTLHLFDIQTIRTILSEIKRVLKNNGKILLDFATDISRLDSNNNQVVFDNEGNYTVEQAINIFQDNLRNFSFSIEKASFKEENLEESTGYNSIVGRFLIVSGECRNKIIETENERE